MPNPLPENAVRARALWVAFLVAASVAFSLGFACAVPLAAFGAVAAITLRRVDALLLLGGVWLANQIVGFGWLHYPHTAGTAEWGAILGVLALLCAVVPAAVARRLPATAGALPVLLAAFATAFAVYEGGLFLISATIMGGTETFAPAIVARVFVINAAAAAALFALHRAARPGATALPAVAPAA